MNEPLQSPDTLPGPLFPLGTDVGNLYRAHNELVSMFIAAIDRINELEAKYEGHRHNQQQTGNQNVYRTSTPKEPDNE